MPGCRYYTYRHSRGSMVGKEVLGEEFGGALVTDFYGAYNFYDGVKRKTMLLSEPLDQQWLHER